MRLRRFFSSVIALSMILSLLPQQFVFAQSEEESQIQNELLSSVDAEEYPDGMFDFLTSRMETSEDISSAEFAIIRRGNTDNAASVTFKAIDMTAKYGEDYIIKVEDTFFDKEIEPNPDATTMLEGEIDESEASVSLMENTESVPENTESATEGESVPENTESAADVESVPENTESAADVESVPENTESVTDGESAPENTESVTDGESAPENTESVADGESVPEALEENTADGENESNVLLEGDGADFDDAEVLDNEPVSENKPFDLRSARTALTGAQSDYSSWRDADKEETALLSDTYNDMYAELEGVSYTLDFEPGEYMKKLKFETIDDDISEDEEQVLFVLMNPEGCAISENPTAFMNIKDNEEPEEITYGFTQDIVNVGADENKAELTIERKTGLYRYGTVEVASASYTAEAGVYYDAFAAQIAFVPGQKYKKIEIPIKKHPASSAVSFTVRLNESEAGACVNIEPEIISQAQIDNNDVLLMSGEASVSDEPLLKADNSSIWSRTENIRLYASDTSKNNGNVNLNYGWSYGDNRFSFGINGYNQDCWAKFNIDLSMVGKVSVTSEEFYEGTWYDDTWWLFGWHGSKGFYNDMQSYIKIGNSTKVTHDKKYNTTDTITLSDSDRKAGSITFGTKVWNKCKEACGLFNNTVKVHYLPIEVQIGKYDDDAMIQEKIYTSQDKYTNDGKAYLAGTLKFAGEGTDKLSKFFYNNDTVKLEPVFNSSLTDAEKEGIYLWGFKIENKSGASPAFYYVKNDEFSIKDLYTGKLKDSISGLTIKDTAKSKHTINGEDFVCYQIYPVFKQKTAYTTMKIDESKAKFATGTFKNEETVKTGRLDKIQYNLVGAGDYAVSGYNYYCNNRNSYSSTTADSERSIYSENLSAAQNIYKTQSPLYKSDSSWSKSVVNAEAAQPASYLFSPLKTDNVLEALYEKPEITVAVNPRANSASDQEKGSVVYVPEDGSSQNSQTAQYTGKDSYGLLRGDEISVSPFKVNNTYQFIASFSDETDDNGNPQESEIAKNYKMQWQDFTGDINRDGILDKNEIKALGDSYNYINKGVFAGDLFKFVPQVSGNPVLYFNIVPKSIKDTDFKNSLAGNVRLSSCSVIENSKPIPSKDNIPLQNAVITAGGYSVQTDSNGDWSIEAPEFDAGETYFIILGYGNRSYTGQATVNRFANDFLVDEYNTFNVKNFNAYRVTNDSEYDNIEDWQLHSISNQAISNEDKRHLYTFEIEELIPNTAVVGKVEVERHSSDGTLKKTYTAVYNEESGVYEVKDPDLLTQYKDNPDEYNYSFNPASENVAPGDYLTIRVYDTEGIGYIKHNVGMTYKPKLSVINLVNSFKSPFNGVIEFIGNMDMAFDLGLTQGLDTADGKLSDKIEEKFDVETTDTERTISFGWSKNFKKSYDSDDKDDKDKKAETVNDKVKTEAGKLDNLENKTDDEKTPEEKEKDDAIKKEATQTAQEAVDKEDKSTEKKGKVTAELSVDLNVAVSLIMGYDTEENRYYFKDFVVVGVIDGTASAKQQYTTPIGITIFAREELSGNITALMAVEPYYQTPQDPQYLYIDEAGTIDLTKLGNSDVDRQLSIYGKLMIRPKITLSAGAELASDKIASVTLNGIADFDMMFTTAGNGIGDVTLSANLVLDILGGVVKKKWDIVEKKYNMFNINGTERALLMSQDDYRYDIITPEDTDERLYLANKSDWMGDLNENILLTSSGSEKYDEQDLLNGVYPYAYPQIVTIKEGHRVSGTESIEMLVFLDADEDGTSLKYSIYENGVWSQPQDVDDDGRNDDSPEVYDFGDNILITWSSEDALPDDADVIERLNSRNIRSVFFNKETMTFGEVQQVTMTTDQDHTADDHAAAAYYEGENGEKQLLLTYVKTDYQKSDDEIAVGDILNAYSTIAYRFYDFDTNSWVDTYSDSSVDSLLNIMSNDEVSVFENNWYGQNFIDLSKYTEVDDSAFTISADDKDYAGFGGLWSREPSDSEIYLTSISSDPLVIEHESIASGKYAVSVYLLDLDKNSETLDDRDIFLQFYDFEQKKFYPMVRLTNDAVIQSYLTLSDTPQGVVLFYIDDGNIVEKNIGDMIDRCVSERTANDGTQVLLNSEYYKNYIAPVTIVEAEENNPYTEFIVNTDNYNVYLTWSQSGISFKDGIDRNSDEATDPENYFAERQLYMAMESFDEIEYPLLDENGDPLLYPETDKEGNTIDYNLTEDINGNVGAVKAGDPIVEIVRQPKWSKPVQMTNEQGANLSDIDCVIHDDGIIRCVYLKGMSQISDVSGTVMPTEDVNNRSLIVSDFSLDAEDYSLEFNNISDISAGCENMPVYLTVKNNSILAMTNINVNLYQITGDNKELVGTEKINDINGGDTAQVTILWNVPEKLDGVSVAAEVEQGGITYAPNIIPLSSDAMIEITDISHIMLDRNSAALSVDVTNSGSEKAEGEKVYVKCGETEFASEEFDLMPNETATVSIDVQIPEDTFKEANTDTKIAEVSDLSVYSNASVKDYQIIRSADISLADFADLDISLLDNSGKTIENNISMTKDEVINVSASIQDKSADVILSSDNNDVVFAASNTLIAESDGTAKITAQVIPSASAFVASDVISTENMQTQYLYNTIPSSLIKTITINAKVGNSGTVSSGGGGGGTLYYTVIFDSMGGSGVSSVNVNHGSSIAVPEEPVKDGYVFDGWFTDKDCTKPYDFTAAVNSNLTLYAKWTQIQQQPSAWNNPFTDVKESDWFFDNVRYVYENGLFSGISDTEFAPNTAMTRAMLVTVLYRAEGESDISNENLGYPFADVEPDSWYTDAVYWARLNGIVEGYDDETFGTNDEITREQIAAIMFRYAKFKGVAPEGEWAIQLDYNDLSDISDWAVEAVMFCKLKGIMTGNENNEFKPLDSALRSEVAAILQRFLEN